MYVQLKSWISFLAVAESGLEFEHRDLHWGNILVKECPKDSSHIFKLGSEGIEKRVDSFGVLATIIDFSLSRIALPSGTVVFNNLAEDPDLFTAEGDYQFDIYR